MTNLERLDMVKAFLGEPDADDDTILAYLKMAEKAIISWKYSYAPEETPAVLDSDDEIVLINAVIAGYSIRGSENQTQDDEGNINRKFKFVDTLDYIHGNVIPYARV